MAKQGMRRPDPKAPHGTESNRISHFPKNEAAPVPEIRQSKNGKSNARPIVENGSTEMKVFHQSKGGSGNPKTGM
jgi:hypothetical protein